MRHRERNVGLARPVPIFGGVERETMDDDPTFSKVPAWKPMSKSKVRVTDVKPGYYSYMWRDSWTGKWYGPVDVWSGDSLLGPSGFNAYTQPPDFPEMDPQVGMIWKSIKNYGKSDVNIGVFLAELRQTVQMFHRPWSLVADVASGKFRIPKGLKSLKGVVDFVNSQYLGYRYGWRPFISDVQGFTRLTRRLDQSYRADLARKPMTLKVFSNTQSSNTRKGQSDYAPGPAYQVAWENTAEVSINRCEWCLVQSNPSNESRSLANKFASTMHLSDVASLAWELVPYSFVADWFLPIGDAIESSLGSPANIVAASQPWQWTETTQKIMISNTGYGSPSWISNISFGYTVESTSFSRSSLGAFPPKPSDIDGFQKLDLASLVGQRLGGLFGKSFRR